MHRLILLILCAQMLLFVEAWIDKSSESEETLSFTLMDQFMCYEYVMQEHSDASTPHQIKQLAKCLLNRLNDDKQSRFYHENERLEDDEKPRKIRSLQHSPFRYG